ncbi:MAG: AAA family ATPase [Anaerolineae bacterium]|nr:AAA family ATPase [Anaerolineae bacterium]
MLRIYTLGGFELRWQDDKQLPKPVTVKAQALLVYLATHPKQHTRGQLSDMFWEDRPERKARRSLSTALWHIRRCLPKAFDYIQTDSDVVHFNHDAPFWVDTLAFVEYATSKHLSDWQAAIALYRGQFLEGFFDDWIVTERYRLETVYANVLTRVMDAYELSGDCESALSVAMLLLEHDPLREDAHQMIMRVYQQMGQRSAALQQYERCRQLLRDELGIEPQAETRQLRQLIVTESVASEQMQMPVVRPVRRKRGIDPRDAAQTVPLVGRDTVLELLANGWHSAMTGECSLMLVEGEAGVGKSRLVGAFADRMRWNGAHILHGCCYELERLSPYQPIVEALRQLPTELIESVSAELPLWVRQQIARLLPEYHAGLNVPAFGVSSGADPFQLFDGLSRLLVRLAVQLPLLIVLDDLHWASDSTLQLLHYLTRQLTGQSVFMVGTYRVENIEPDHPLATLSRRLERNRMSQHVRLEPLTQPDVIELVGQISGCDEAVRSFAERLYRETEGNPLFLIEIVKSLFETGQIRLEQRTWQADFEQLSRADLPLSDTIETMIQARFGRMSDHTQSVAQVAAVAGKTFDFDLLGRVTELDETDMLVSLDDLLRQRLIEESGADSDYTFAHHLIREVIYRDVPRHRRFQLHGCIGLAIEQSADEVTGASAGNLAFHFEQACRLNPELSWKAITYLQLAGRYAVRQSANREAIAYFRRGLSLLQSLPETPEHLHKGVELRLDLTIPATVVHGYAAPETARVYSEAYAYCRKSGQTADLFTALLGLARNYGTGGEAEKGLAISEQLLAIALAEEDGDLLLEACRENGGNLLVAGSLQKARLRFEQGLALYDPAYHETHAYRFGHDPAISLHGYLSKTLWLMGYPELARNQSDALAQLMPSMTHRVSRVYAHAMQALCRCMQGDAASAKRYAETAMSLGRSFKLTNWTAFATALHGWSLCLEGDLPEGLSQLREGTAQWRASGAAYPATQLIGWQADACLQLGEWGEGVEALTLALEIAQSSGSVYWLAELERLRGALQWAMCADVDVVVATFRCAMHTASQQGARMLELRAATSLAQLWQQIGRCADARRMLIGVYDKFEQKGDFPELVSAESLLQSLAHFD